MLLFIGDSKNSRFLHIGIEFVVKVTRIDLKETS